MSVMKHGFVFREPAEKSQAVADRDMKTLSPSYTRSYGFAMSHGKGSKVWDVDGNEYLDFAAGIAVLATGHSHPKVVDAISTQASQYLHIGATDFFCPQQLALGERLRQITPINGAESDDDKLVYFGNSGTEAVEAALKLARYREGRKYIIGFYGSFHGRSMGSLSVTSSKAIQRAGYSYLPGGVEHVPYPGKFFSEKAKNDSYDWGDSVQFIRDFILKKKFPPNEVAAIIVEPIQGEGGYVVPRDDFFPKLRELCDEYGILLISDEIQAGIGRTGKWWGIEHYGVKPDIICTAKGLGSGLPISAIIAHKDVMGLWVPGAHASTFGGNPVACAAANATLDIIDDGILDHVTESGNYIVERLTTFQQSHPIIMRVDGRGFMIGVDFADEHGNPMPKFRNEVVDHCYLNGLLTLAAGTSALRIAPPLILTREELEQGLDILERAIVSVEQNYSKELVREN